MSDLVLWEDPRTIRVRLPAARSCAAVECDAPAKAQMLWVDQRAEMLWVDEICGVHLFLLRHRVEESGGGGAMFYPLDYSVPVDFIASKIREQKMAEMARQQAMFRQPIYYTPTGGNAFFSGTQTFNIRFG